MCAAREKWLENETVSKVNLLCLIASNYILLIDWSWRKLISRASDNVFSSILFLHPSRSKYPATIVANCLLKMLACLRSCMYMN